MNIIYYILYIINIPKTTFGQSVLYPEGDEDLGTWKRKSEKIKSGGTNLPQYYNLCNIAFDKHISPGGVHMVAH